MFASLSNKQIAFLKVGASYGRDVVKCGKVLRPGDPKNIKAEMLRTHYAVRRDRDRARELAAREANAKALAAFTQDEIAAFATKGEYSKRRYAIKKSSAMPMTFWRGTGYGC